MFKKIKKWFQLRKCAKGQHSYTPGDYVKSRVRQGQTRRVRYWVECNCCGARTEPMNKKRLIEFGRAQGWLDLSDE